MPGYASFRSSVRYLGATAFAFSTNSIICFSSSLGGAVVRVATGTPTSRKNLSLPAGELMRIPSQYIRLHPDETDQLGCLLSGLGAFDSKVQQPFDDRVSDSEPGIERAIWILENDLYPPAERPQLSRRQAGNILPAEVDLSRRRLNQP